MNVIDRIAADHIDILTDEELQTNECESQLFLSKTMPVAEHHKVASFVPSRVSQSIDLDMHQTDETKAFWMVKKGKIIRTVPHFVKG